jgi:heme-degrading monooxygenase HmoA
MAQAREIDQRFDRVDRFTVPQQAREEFIARVRMTHDLLRKQPGFLQDFLLEQPAEPGFFNVVTVVEWENAAVINTVRSVVSAAHRQAGFNPQELIARHGIKAELGHCRRLQPSYAEAAG